MHPQCGEKWVETSQARMSHDSRRGKCIRYRQNKVAIAQSQETVGGGVQVWPKVKQGS